MHPEYNEAAQTAFLAAAKLAVATAPVDDDRATYRERVDAAARSLATALGESRTAGPSDSPAAATPIYDALLVVLHAAG